MRITKPSTKDVSWYLRPFFWYQKKKYGQVLIPALVWARVPSFFIFLSAFYRKLIRKSSPLNITLRALVMTRISQINACEFCMDLNTAALLKREGSKDRSKELASWQTSSDFTEQEKVALDYAEKITYTDCEVDNACFERLQQYFSEKAIIELTALVAFQNLSSKFNSALKIPSQGFCRGFSQTSPKTSFDDTP